MDAEKDAVEMILEEAIGNAQEVKEHFAKNAQEVSELIKSLYAKLYDRIYDSHTYFGYLLHILSMNGGEFIIPAKVRIENHNRGKAQILQTENPDGSCTIRINYVEEENENVEVRDA